MKSILMRPESAVIFCDVFPPDIGGISSTASRVASYLTIRGTPPTVICVKEDFIRTIHGKMEFKNKTQDILTSFDRHTEYTEQFMNILPEKITPAFIVSFYMGRCSYLAYKFNRLLKVRHSIVCVGSDIYQHFERYSVKWRYHKMIKWCSRIGLLSESMSPYFIKYPEAGEKLMYLPFGFDHHLFTPMVAEKQYDFIFVGRSKPVKGLDIFLEALLKVKKSCRVCLVIPKFAADKDFFNKCFSFAQRKLGRHKIKWLPEQTHSELAILYNASRCLVMPSRSEASPHVILEAMSCNIQVIASNVGRVIEMLGTKECIYNTCEELVCLLNTYIDNKFDNKPCYRKRVLEITDPDREMRAYRNFVGLQDQP
ncbi:MAG: glycosyltransferase family 4 protein [Deltaproteobacteria bacterium]|nr:glycosyltransferase family 4 protein [Deltaproteobacteria bacterium]